MDKVISIISRDGKHKGKLTGNERRCRLHGCTGRALEVIWKDGKKTRCCTKGMKYLKNGDMKII